MEKGLTLLRMSCKLLGYSFKPRLTCEQALRDALAAGRELNESLQLRLWYLNISNEKIDAKC